jgi:uncharacterized phage protein gp47/JayE
MYESQTFEVIFNRMLNNIPDDIDKREGSVAWDMLAPKAIELAQIYIELDNILNFGFADTTYGNWIDLKVAEVGISRLTAIQAKGSVTFTGTPDGLVIPEGTIVSTDDGIQFNTDYDVTLNSGTATVTITAMVGGNNGNVAANSIINNGVNGVACTNDQSTAGGTDTESDAALLTRYYEKVREPATSGNVYHYKQWCLEVDGIGDAKVFPIFSGPGTVKVTVVDLDKLPVSDTKVSEVASHIEDVRPVGVDVTVESAQPVNITVDVQLTLNTNYTPQQIQPLVSQAIKDYFKSMAFIDTEVKFSKIVTSILSVDGVIDYGTLTVNDGTANVPIGDNQVPVLVAVNLL